MNEFVDLWKGWLQCFQDLLGVVLGILYRLVFAITGSGGYMPLNFLNLKRLAWFLEWFSIMLAKEYNLWLIANNLQLSLF